LITGFKLNRLPRNREDDGGQVVQEAVLVADSPDKDRQRPEAQIAIGSGGRDPQALRLLANQPGIGDVAIEPGDQVEEQEANFVNFAPVSLARQAVSKLVTGGHGQNSDPGKQQRFPAQRVLERVDDGPVVGPEDDLRGEKEGERHRQESGSPDPPQFRAEKIEQPIGVEQFLAPEEQALLRRLGDDIFGERPRGPRRALSREAAIGCRGIGFGLELRKGLGGQESLRLGHHQEPA
jgi:hypothetical protein